MNRLLTLPDSVDCVTGDSMQFKDAIDGAIMTYLTFQDPSKVDTRAFEYSLSLRFMANGQTDTIGKSSLSKAYRPIYCRTRQASTDIKRGGSDKYGSK